MGGRNGSEARKDAQENLSFLCHDCTADFVAETFAIGRGLEGISYVEPHDAKPSQCDRCDKPLPESPDLEAQAKHLLIRTVVVMRDRNARARKILEGNS